MSNRIGEALIIVVRLPFYPFVYMLSVTVAVILGKLYYSWPRKPNGKMPNPSKMSHAKFKSCVFTGWLKKVSCILWWIFQQSKDHFLKLLLLTHSAGNLQ